LAVRGALAEQPEWACEAGEDVQASACTMLQMQAKESKSLGVENPDALIHGVNLTNIQGAVRVGNSLLQVRAEVNFSEVIKKTSVYRIVAFQQTKINLENERLQVSQVGDGWQSAMWRFEWVGLIPGPYPKKYGPRNVYRIVSAWDGHRNWRINMENERLQAGPVPDAFESALWSVDRVSVLPRTPYLPGWTIRSAWGGHHDWVMHSGMHSGGKLQVDLESSSKVSWNNRVWKLEEVRE